MFDITTIIEALAALIVAVITAFVIPYIKSKTTAQQQQAINSWVRIAVTAAEQIYVGSGRGAEKKEYVLQFLAEHGIKLDGARIDALIEAAVYELNNGFIAIGEPVKTE
ncbi:MAG: Phage holin protein (Holin_LLH) [Firmicutes bacterium ADurb.Bin506]|nr:MAG: Phage holin protein (Holin_LLH) [Firmicutes bacterium ADurb.Bin506]